LVGGRTDNAVKNRFTALMKKISRHGANVHQLMSSSSGGGSSGMHGGRHMDQGYVGSPGASSYLGARGPMFKPTDHHRLSRQHLASAGFGASMGLQHTGFPQRVVDSGLVGDGSQALALPPAPGGCGDMPGARPAATPSPRVWWAA
jgi:hypothetical protein